MSNGNRGYTLKEIALALIPLLGLLAATHYYAFNIGTETYKGALEEAKLTLGTTKEELKKKSDELEKLKIDYVLIEREERETDTQSTPGVVKRDAPKEPLIPTDQATNEITARMVKNSSQIFYEGIYVGCSNLSYPGKADISVSIAEPGKSEIKRKDMQAGDSMELTYKDGLYKLILREVNYTWDYTVVSVAKMN